MNRWLETKEVPVSNRLRLAPTIVGLALLLVALFAGSASAKGGGQLESWGAAGTGNGQFLNPGLLGVDNTSGTVYGGDVSSDKQKYRIQQLSATGEFKASTTIPRFAGTEIITTLHGIAVDPSLGRFYVIEGCKVATASLTCKKTGSIFGARQILAYSTTPEAGKLVPAATPTIALPSGEKELYFPQAISVDPANHDLVILAEDANHHTVVQRFSSAGVEGARFTDSENKLRPSGATSPAAGKDATSIAVSPSGITYALTGNPNTSGATRAWQLPANLSKVEQVPGFAEAAEKENWTAAMTSSPESLIGGQQLAISTDGATLYWKEKITGSEPTEAGNILVRGFSLAGKETTALWGNGTTTCKITTTNSGIAAGPSGKLVVFDYGPSTEPPPYGVKVLTFGPTGTGCPEPKAKFTINGKKEGEEPTGIKPGDTVSFDAASSELLGGFRRELIWKFGDGSEKVVKYTPGVEGEADKEAVTTVTHVYSTAAKVTVRLEIKLSGAPLGNPAPVERTFTVGTPVAKSFKLTVTKGGTGTGTVSSAPAGINCGPTCEAEFAENEEVTLTPVASGGSEFKGWSGACTGIGACKVMMSAAKSVGVEFGLVPTFNLKVTKTGAGTGTVTSTPSGINCGSTCAANFDFGTAVTLTAASGPHSKAVLWSGCDEIVGANECKVTTNAAKEVTAAFALEQLPLKVTKTGAGSGTVTSTPSGISCGSTCAANFDFGTAVTLTAASGPHSKAVLWSGCDEIVGANECKVTTNAAKEVTAAFALEQLPLKVTKTGAGSGTVTSTPSGISCGSTCAANFDFGTAVTLSGAAEAGSKAVLWSGCDEIVGANECQVTIDSAKEVTALFELSSGGSGLYCTGESISAAGAPLQLAAHNEVWAPAFAANVCPGGPTVTYAQGPGISAWSGPFDHSVAFIGTDQAPTAAQIATIKSAAAAGVQLAVIPVAQTAVAVIANPPAGCEVEEITSNNLTAVFEGRLRNWSELASAEGAPCAAPITRVVPKDAEGVTTQFKNYLYQLNKKTLACTSPKQTWAELQAANTSWPQSCSEKALSALLTPAAAGGAEEVNTVNATTGAIGFAVLPDARATTTKILALQNNGYAPLGEATYASPASGAAANCSSMSYKTPAGGGGLDLDWSQVFGAKPAIGAGAYPLCMLTYDLAFHGYEAAGFSVGQERTVKDYLSGYVTQAGQAAISTDSYSPLPSSPETRLNVLGEARKAAAKIIR